MVRRRTEELEQAEVGAREGSVVQRRQEVLGRHVARARGGENLDAFARQLLEAFRLPPFENASFTSTGMVMLVRSILSTFSMSGFRIARPPLMIL